MGLVIGSVANQQSVGTGITTTDEDIRFNYNAHSLHFDVFAYKDEGTAATVQNLIGDKITQMRLNTQNGTPEISWRVDDWHDFHPLALGLIPYVSILTSTDNIPHGFGLQYPFSPFPWDPTKNFGAPANFLTQFVIDSVADVNQDFDGYVYDLTVEGLDTSDKPNSLGYVRATQDVYTAGSVGEIRPTQVNNYKRLLGVYNFMTTSFDDLAAAAAFDVIGIRQQAVAYGKKTSFNYKPSRAWSMKLTQDVATFAAAAAVINVLDEGRWFADYGMLNQLPNIGLASVPNTTIETTAGVAEATRVIPIALV